MVAGQCLCGAVSFETKQPIKGSAHCHCSYCRKAHGAALVTWIVFLSDQLSISGEANLKWFSSSRQSRRGFCRVCGSSMFFESEVCPGETHVARALIEGSVERAPAVHCFTDQQVDWFAFTDALPRLSSTSEELARYAAVEPRGAENSD